MKRTIMAPHPRRQTTGSARLCQLARPVAARERRTRGVADFANTIEQPKLAPPHPSSSERAVTPVFDGLCGGGSTPPAWQHLQNTAPMAKRSAGILMYRRSGERIELLLVHPGGPFWARKDDGVWSIPKGLCLEGEDPLAAARREFAEETGCIPSGNFIDLGYFRQPGGKIVAAWALEGDFDTGNLNSNLFAMEWPPKSGRMQEFPEGGSRRMVRTFTRAAKDTEGAGSDHSDTARPLGSNTAAFRQEVAVEGMILFLEGRTFRVNSGGRCWKRSSAEPKAPGCAARASAPRRFPSSRTDLPARRSRREVRWRRI